MRLLLLLHAIRGLHRPSLDDCRPCDCGLCEQYFVSSGSELIRQIGYLIYLIVHSKSTIPILSIIMLAAIYGLQALVFIFRMRWDMIAWMICEFPRRPQCTDSVVYILAIPVFSFFLPLYSFWKMDDFSWGSTRLGESSFSVICGHTDYQSSVKGERR